jgi:hypothetical protein
MLSSTWRACADPKRPRNDAADFHGAEKGRARHNQSDVGTPDGAGYQPPASLRRGSELTEEVVKLYTFSLVGRLTRCAEIEARIRGHIEKGKAEYKKRLKTVESLIPGTCPGHLWIP